MSNKNGIKIIDTKPEFSSAEILNMYSSDVPMQTQFITEGE